MATGLRKNRNHTRVTHAHQATHPLRRLPHPHPHPTLRHLPRATPTTPHPTARHRPRTLRPRLGRTLPPHHRTRRRHLLDLRTARRRHHRPHHPTQPRRHQPPSEPRRSTPTMQQPTQVHIICGPPGAGKTTHVNRHASPGALIVDYDTLYAALTGLPVHVRAPTLGPHWHTLHVRDALLSKLTHDPKKRWRQ